MAHDVFISYSTRDKAVADAACAVLEGRGIRCWIAPRDVPPGKAWSAALVDAIHAGRVFVLVFSDGANHSPQVLREVAEAVDRGIPIIPFRIEDVQPSKEIGYYIKTIHWLDALTPPLERHLQKLAETAQVLLRIEEEVVIPPKPPIPEETRPRKPEPPGLEQVTLRRTWRGWPIWAWVTLILVLPGLVVGGWWALTHLPAATTSPSPAATYHTTTPTLPTTLTSVAEPTGEAATASPITEAAPIPAARRFYLHADGILALDPPPSSSSSHAECFLDCTQTWAITLTQPLQGDAYGYDLAGTSGNYNARLLHTRGDRQTVLAEWLSREGWDSGWTGGPQLDAIPGDSLTLEIALPAGGRIQLYDYDAVSYVSVGFAEGTLPEEPTPLPPESPETSPHPGVAIDPDDVIHLAWADTSSGIWDIYYALSTDGGDTFSEPIQINAEATSAVRGHPTLAVGSDGRVHVAWEEMRDGDWDIYYAHLESGGSFSAPIQDSDDATGTDQTRPAIAVERDGTVHLAWQDSRAGNWDIYYARSTDGAASFEANLRVNEETRGQQVDPAIGVDGQGRVHVAWADDRSVAWAVYHARSEGEGFLRGRVVGSGLMSDLSNSLPSLAVGQDDSVHIAWANAYVRHPDYDALLYLPVYAVSADGGDTFSDPRQVGEGYGYVSTRPPETGLGAGDGAAHVVLTTYSPQDGSWVWYYRSRDSGQSFSAGVGVEQAGGGDVLHYPVVAADGTGRVHVAWAHQRGDEWDVCYARSSDGGVTFSDGVRVSGGR
jgi:hypothetical protein